MRWLSLIALLQGSNPLPPPAPAVTVVQPGETLATVAKRAMGDEDAGAELKALNGLADDDVPPGTRLKLPGPDRALAVSALGAARRAVEQARDGERRSEAAQRLKESEGLLRSARYAEASRAADGAWRLVSEEADQATRFGVKVDDRGGTRIVAHAGTPVLVEGQGVTRRVYPGHRVNVDKGSPPADPRPQLTVPTPLAPVAGGRVRLGTVGLSWQPVPGADQYEVELFAADGTLPRSFKAFGPRLSVADLGVGRYQWTVRALAADGERSEQSPLRTFELVDDPLRLEVGETEWK